MTFWVLFGTFILGFLAGFLMPSGSGDDWELHHVENYRTNRGTGVFYTHVCYINKKTGKTKCEEIQGEWSVNDLQRK